MCTRFVYLGNNVITGFNFDIDLSVWKHKVFEEQDRFYIGILRPDGVYHSYHGVNQNGNTGTMLYVHGNSAGAYQNSRNCITIADLTEQFIKAQPCWYSTKRGVLFLHILKRMKQDAISA